MNWVQSANPPGNPTKYPRGPSPSRKPGKSVG